MSQNKQNIAFIDLQKQQLIIKESLHKRLNRVLDHGKYIMGPEIDEMEERLAEYVGVKHCISLSSGTDALLVPMMALGIGSGDEVITTPFTFIATAEMIELLGAKPVFVDINPMTYNIDPESIKKAITKKTRAIIPVSLYGQCADLDAINDIAGTFGLPVIEDAAQSFGATYKGRKSCGLSTVGCTSFFPSKPLGCYGDGGACFTNDDDLALKMRQIRVHGQDRRYHHPLIGINARMDTIQAAVILAKLEIFDDEVKSRMEIGARYTELLRDHVITPYVEPFNTSVYAQYTIQVDERDHLIAKLGEAGIPTAVHYPVPLHKQPAFVQYSNIHLPVAEKISRRVVSLPMHPYLNTADQDSIVKNIIMR
ncbi:MAG TPA: DegT/DnrJ/EryC1/StrS family aminotransferase [Spirochaetota bacterium]|nr:DegT/DnrJ/EryC1/StrS family aminotransferase [Spirochaetota bacterium]HPI88794.1 DegT/DnrJ/EryC1/StrS family aminotransferase [Spirochaetota bacterium]HPR47132.1 DegT/DnrJ/EryC1/StrS family aminotransferase [Spirochaetota bacterium]